MIRSLLRAALLSLALATPLAAVADESRMAVLGREIQALTAYNVLLAEKYNSDAQIWFQFDELIDLIDEFHAGGIDPSDLRAQLRTRVTAIEHGLHALEADLAKLPELPPATLPQTKKVAQSIDAFRSYVLGMTQLSWERLRLVEQMSAAALANDVARYDELQREHFKFIAEEIDGETAVLRTQLEFIDPKSYITPLHHCSIHLNNAFSALLRSWADAEEIDLSAAMGIMAGHLEKAELARQNGDRKVRQQTAVWKARSTLLGSSGVGAKEMEELFENLRKSYGVEQQLVDVTRAFGKTLAEVGNGRITDEATQSFDKFWMEMAALVNQRLELGVERQEIAGRIGAALQ